MVSILRYTLIHWMDSFSQNYGLLRCIVDYGLAGWLVVCMYVCLAGWLAGWQAGWLWLAGRQLKIFKFEGEI